MNATGTDEITAYVEAVRAALAGLPETTRNELLEDLPEHLAEVAADGIGTLTDRLGPPSVYAAELLASAGFVGGFPDPPPSVDRYAELREVTLHRLRIADAKVGPLFGYARASEFLTLLRPAWWVLRGYLAAMVIAWLLDDSGQPIGLLPRIGGSEVVALLLLAASVLGSIWLGRRSLRLATWPRYALWAGWRCWCWWRWAASQRRQQHPRLVLLGRQLRRQPVRPRAGRLRLRRAGAAGRGRPAVRPVRPADPPG